jgi:hypothetical protein
MAAVIGGWFALGALGQAHAADPKFEFGKDEEVKAVEWKAAAQGGLVLTTGNSRTTTLSGGVNASRKAGGNKLSIELALAYTQTEILVAADTNGTPGIGPGEIQTIDQVTAEAWTMKARYDRFLTKRNSLYLTGLVMADEPAGKELIGGGQIGYSRLLLKTEKHELAAELGYDFTHEDYVAPGDPLNIHSLRAFVGYTGTLTKATQLSASTELLENLNEEAAPGGDIAPFEDARLTSKVALTTALSTDLSVRVAFTARYDAAPAPQPPFGAVPYEPGFTPLADELDTTTELQLIVSLI